MSSDVALRDKSNGGLISISKAKELLATADIDTAIDLRDKASAFAAYLKARNDSYDAQCSATEIKLRAERKAGELLAEMDKPKNQHDCRSQDATTKLESLGVNKSQSSRWQEEAKVDEDQFVEWVEEVKTKGEELTQSGLLKLARGRTVAASANTGEIEWYTPEEFVELARDVMGSIDCDPASSDAANEIVCAKEYFTRDDDGLAKDWCGNVWMNPPYAAGVVSQFTQKLLDELECGNCKQAVVLLNNATDTLWFASLVSEAAAVCFKTGRIAFINQDGNAVAGAAQGQVFIYFGKRVSSFCKLFSRIGWVAEVKHGK